MNDTKSQPAASHNEAEIRTLIERWAKAVREEDRAAIRADHDPGILMFDVPPPFLSRGLDDYMATWETFFRSSEKPVAFAFHDVQVTGGQDVGFAGHSLGITVNYWIIRLPGKNTSNTIARLVGVQRFQSQWSVG